MKLKKYPYISLFEILNSRGVYGLIEYLESQNDEMLRVLAYQYSANHNNKDRKSIIKEILVMVEGYWNIGWVFSDSPKLEIAKYYK